MPIYSLSELDMAIELREQQRANARMIKELMSLKKALRNAEGRGTIQFNGCLVEVSAGLVEELVEAGLCATRQDLESNLMQLESQFCLDMEGSSAFPR